MEFYIFVCERPIYILFIYLSLITLATFFVFGIDKLRAKRGKYRVRESTLFWLCILGGSLGGLAGMYVFRHKTLHRKFTVGVPLILTAQIALAVLVAVLANK
ncbi:MAG: DUF1294 domain-containing protein [Clostridia bacterium]|nr:DUF1294 domain-containing protein [Clostridia bacterium]